MQWPPEAEINPMSQMSLNSTLHRHESFIWQQEFLWPWHGQLGWVKIQSHYQSMATLHCLKQYHAETSTFPTSVMILLLYQIQKVSRIASNVACTHCVNQKMNIGTHLFAWWSKNNIQYFVFHEKLGVMRNKKFGSKQVKSPIIKMYRPSAWKTKKASRRNIAAHPLTWLL